MKTREALERENARLRGDLLTFSSRINHDLRTPLGGIVSIGELLREILAEKDPSSTELTSTLFQAVDEMTKVIKTAGLVARASATPPKKETVAMDRIVRNVLQRLESRILRRGATVKVAGTWPKVAAVAEWIEFTWMTFLLNALQHGGSDVELGWETVKTGHRFWLTDGGEPIPPGVREKLFQAFDSLNQPDSTRGLSLSAVRRLVELQEGTCGYDGDEKKGGVFFFILPAKKIEVKGFKDEKKK